MKATKRILSVLLAVLLMVSAVVTAAAYGAEDGYKPEYQYGKDLKPDPTYKELIYAAMGWSTTFDEPEDDMYVYNFICGYNADGSSPIEGATPDYIVCFAAYPMVSPSTYSEIIGNYVVSSFNIHGPYELGYHVYCTANAEIYTLSEAYDADLPNMDYVLNMLGAKKYQYRDVFEEYIMQDADPYSTLMYEELYFHYSSPVSSEHEATPDYVVVFASDGPGEPAEPSRPIGNYIVGQSSWFAPYDLGYFVYIPAEDSIYTLEEAYREDLPDMDYVLSMLGDKKYQYRDLFEKYLEYDPETSHYFGYEELYSYYGSDDNTADDATPDYMLIFACNEFADPSYAYGVFGGYILQTGHYSGNQLAHYVVVPEEDNRIYTLTEAWEAQLEGIEAVFTDYGLGRMIGDMDNDRRLTVKDATYIQKCLAGLLEFPVEDGVHGSPEVYDGSPNENLRYISDFDGDDRRTIKDATAIQKHIAGIVDTPDEPEYKIPEDALFEENCIIVSTDNADGENFTLEDFSEYEFVSMEKYEFLAREGAMYTLYLKNPGKESVEAAVNALLYRVGRDLSAVHPNWYAVVC